MRGSEDRVGRSSIYVVRTLCSGSVGRDIVHGMVVETAFRSEEQFEQEEFRRWLDRRPRADINHYELIHGRIVMTPPAGWPHGSIETRISAALDAHVRAKKLGIVLGSSAGYELPSGDTLEPDVSFISSKRFAAGPKPIEGQFLRIVPSLVVEILSRSTARRDRTEKKGVYASNGVDEYWLVDATRKEIIVFYRTARGFAAGKTCSRGHVPSKVLPALKLQVKDAFAL
jgi:Uma2 family endonuclease